MTEPNYKLNLRSDWESRSSRASLRSAVVSLFKAVHILVNIFIASFAWSVLHSNYGFFAQTTFLLMFIFGSLTYILIKTYNGFQVGLRTVDDLAFSQGLALLFSTIGISLVETLLLKSLPNLWIVGLTLVIHIGWSVIWCMLAERLFDYLFPALKTAIVYQYREALEAIKDLYQNEKRFKVIKTIDATDNLDAILSEFSDMEAVFLCGMASPKRNDILKYCIEQGIRAYVRPKISDVILSSAENMQMFHVPVLFCRRRIMSLSYRVTKRSIDILLAAMFLLIASPFMLITAVAIKAYDRGPTFYKQKRITRNGRIFQFLKFGVYNMHNTTYCV